MATIEKYDHILASFILFSGTLLMGTVPVYIFEFLTKRAKKRVNTSIASLNKKSSTIGSWFDRLSQDAVVQFLTQIGGGVLLYTAFIHMLPEIRENYRINQNEDDNHNCNSTNYDTTGKTMEESNGHNSLPIVDIVVCAGFFGMFFIEELMHTLLLKNHHHHYEKPEQSKPNEINRNRTLNAGELHNNPEQCGHALSKRKDTIVSISSGKSLNLNVGLGKISQGSQTNLEKIPISNSRRTSYNACELTKVMCEDGQIDCKVNCSKENLIKGKLVKEKDCSVKARLVDCILIILAFSCHSVFDGISIGVQQRSKEVWQLLIAILSHKLIIAFILSFQIYERCQETITLQPFGQTERRQIKYSKVILWCFSALFALMSPIGIYLVMFMNGISANENDISVILLAAVSVGTILYIVFIEILDKTSVRVHISGLVQLAAIVIGFLTMHLIATMFQE